MILLIYFVKAAKLIITLLTDKHVAVGVVGDGEEMRRHLVTSFTAVLADDVGRVDRQATVGVDDDAKQTRVCLLSPHNRCPPVTQKCLVTDDNIPCSFCISHNEMALQYQRRNKNVTKIWAPMN